MISFKEYLAEEAPVNDTLRTQNASTKGTYTKTGVFLAKLLEPGSRVLSHGAGLDHTGRALRAALGRGHTVHDFEPNPQKRKKPPEYSEAKKIPSGQYHAVVSHNVLNVLPPEDREGAMHSLFRSVKTGGHIVIGTRKWKGDVDQVKSFETGEEPRSVWVKAGKSMSYQKGFDGDELKEYVAAFAKQNGHEVSVTRAPNVGAANAVHVRVIKKGKPKKDLPV